MADSVTQVRIAGPVGTKRNLAILGDGFAAADQAAYNNWVQTAVLDGVFGHDYFFEDLSAWNIFRVNLESVDSGISTRVYNEMGTPADGSDDTIASDTARNTALGMIFSGSWAHCWMERRQHRNADPECAQQMGARLPVRAHRAEHDGLRRMRRRRPCTRDARERLGRDRARVRARSRRSSRRYASAAPTPAASRAPSI